VKKVEFGGFGQAMDGVINNQVDAAFSSTISGQAYKIASSPRGIRYPKVPHDDKAAWTRIRKTAPFFVPAWGTEGAELSKDNKVEGATYPYPVLMTMAATDADLVYNMTKAMVELFDDYKDGAPGNVGWDLKRQVFAWAIPLHDGAIRYFKERGVWTAEHQKHNDALIARQKTLAAAWEGFKGKAPSSDEEFSRGWMKARHEALAKAGMEPVLEAW
jgi:TRAP transporter TAXI family solute receptor